MRCPTHLQIRFEHNLTDTQRPAGNFETRKRAKQIDAVALHRHDTDAVERDIEMAELLSRHL